MKRSLVLLLVLSTACLVSAKVWLLDPALPLWDVANQFDDSITINEGESIRFTTAFAIHDVFIGTTPCDASVKTTYKNCDAAIAETKWQPASCGCEDTSPLDDGCLDVAASTVSPFPGALDDTCTSLPSSVVVPIPAFASLYFYHNDIEFSTPGTYYAMCTAGTGGSHCLAGMRIKIIVQALKGKATASDVPYQLPYSPDVSPWGLYQEYPDLHISQGDNVEFSFDENVHNIFTLDVSDQVIFGGADAVANAKCNQLLASTSAFTLVAGTTTANLNPSYKYSTVKVPFPERGAYFVGCSFHCSLGMQFIVFVD